MSVYELLKQWQSDLRRFISTKGMYFYSTAVDYSGTFARTEKDVWAGEDTQQRLQYHPVRNDPTMFAACIEELAELSNTLLKAYGTSPILICGSPVIWASLCELDRTDASASVAAVYATIQRQAESPAQSVPSHPFFNYALCGFYENYAKDGGWVINPNFGAQYLITQFITPK